MIFVYTWHATDVGNGPSGDMQCILLHGVIYVCTVGLLKRTLASSPTTVHFATWSYLYVYSWTATKDISKLAEKTVTHLQVQSH